MSAGGPNDFAIEDEVFQANLVRWANKKHLAFGEAVRRAGRIAAVNYAKFTQPFGFDSSSREQGESAVARDIRRVYAPGWWIFKQIAAKDEKLADAWWHFYSLGNKKRAGQLLEVSGLDPGLATLPIETLDPAKHQNARNSRGRVPRTQPFLAILTPGNKLQTYIRKEQKLVGFVKGAYAAAARVLGGTRGIPQWVTRHRSSPGNCVDASDHRNDPHVEIQNRVSYASDAIRESDKKAALTDARDNMVAFLRKQLGEDDFSSSTAFNPNL